MPKKIKRKTLDELLDEVRLEPEENVDDSEEPEGAENYYDLDDEDTDE